MTTDGMENASRQYSAERIREMITAFGTHITTDQNCEYLKKFTPDGKMLQTD